MAKPQPPLDRELLSGYVDNELSAEQRARVEWWIEHDATVRAEVESLRDLGAALRERTERVVPSVPGAARQGSADHR